MTQSSNENKNILAPTYKQKTNQLNKMLYMTNSFMPNPTINMQPNKKGRSASAKNNSITSKAAASK